MILAPLLTLQVTASPVDADKLYDKIIEQSKEQANPALKTNETYRTLDNEGAVTDGKGIKKGEKFRTASGRLTTPYPKQIAARYSAQWLIDNATQEAESRGDDFNATIFKGTTLLKNGTLVPGDKEHERILVWPAA